MITVNGLIQFRLPGKIILSKRKEIIIKFTNTKKILKIFLTTICTQHKSIYNILAIQWLQSFVGHHFIVPSFHVRSVLPCGHVTIRPCHIATISPCRLQHHPTVPPSNHLTFVSCHIVPPCHLPHCFTVPRP